MARKKTADKVASVAAAAAAAAVKASEDKDKVQLNWAADDEDDEGDQELDDEILEAIAKIDESEGGELCWWELYCDTPIDKQGQIRKLGTSEIRGLRDECLGYGPGEYHIVARRKNGTFVKNSRLKVRISGFARNPNGTFATPATTTDPMVLLERLDARNEQRAREAKATRDQQIKFWAPLLIPIGTELAKGLFGRSNGESIKDLVAAMVGMKELVGKPSSEVDTLMKGVELARQLEPPEAAKGSTWPDVVVNGVTSLAKEFRPLVEYLSTRKNGNGAAVAQPPAALQFQTAPAQPAAQLSTQPAAAAPAAPSEDPMWQIALPILKKLAVELEDFAVNGADPVLAAEAVLAKVPRIVINQVDPKQLKEWLSQPNWWPLTVQFHQPLERFQGFCDDVRLTLLQIVEDKINPPPADGGDGEGGAQ